MDTFTYQEGSKYLLARVPKGNPLYSQSVATALLTSVERLQGTNPDAILLLEFFALLTPDGILIDFIRAGRTKLSGELKLIFDEVNLNESLGSLEEYSLIQRSANSESVYVHRIVQLIVRNSLEEEAVNELHKIVLAVSDAAFPYATDKGLALGREFYAQVMPCLQSTEYGDSKQLASLFLRVGHFLFRETRYEEARSFIEKSLQISQRTQDDNESVKSDVEGLVLIKAE
jgi:hypothetical protein